MRKLALPALICALLLTACPASNGGGNPPPADITAPTVTLSRGATTVEGKITLNAAVADNVAVTKVEFYQGTTLLGSDAQAPYTLAAEYLNDRTNFTAKAYDAAGNTGTSAAFNITTLYQGLWGWAIGTPDGGTILDSGLALFYTESNVLGTGPVAGGLFENEAGTNSGNVLMGPIGGAGQLEVGFIKVVPVNGGAEATPYVLGADADKALGTFQGSATFEGSGLLYQSSGTSQNVIVALLQYNAEAPAPQGLRLSTREAARNLAINAVRQRKFANTPLPGMNVDALLKINSTLFKR